MGRQKSNRRKRPLKNRVFSGVGIAKKLIYNLVPIVIVLTILALVPIGVYFSYKFVVSSEHFALSQISVKGTNRINDSRLLEHMSVFPGMNVFDIHTERALHAAKLQPWAKEVSVKVRYPNALDVEITEHLPAAIVDFRMGLMFVDAEGALITEASHKDLENSGESKGLPYVSGTSRLNSADAAEIFLDAIAIYRQMDEMGFAPLSELNYDENLGFSAILFDGKEIRVGRDEFEKRLKRAKRVLSQDDDIAYVLVDHALEANRVIVGMKTSSKEGSEEPASNSQGR